MIDIMPTSGREVVAELAAQLDYLMVLSRGDPAWDAQWAQVNPPAPDLGTTDVLDVIGYARPTVIGFVEPDEAGAIAADTGAKYSVSAEPTRFLRLRMSIPAGSFSGETVREIGIFARPTIADTVAPGQTIIAAGDVQSAGKLFEISWFRPQFLSPGTLIARNFIVRL